MSAADPAVPNPTGAPGNRLATASSPYLRLHAHNPVDWYPWGEEALARARREDKPIFLSIGYSTCYWCHVMERESFSDPGIAEAMNRSFVNVKLDREERPDLDEVYMTATQLMTGQGGWPNSLFLTPALDPFFAGTYFPPEDKWGRPGFRSVLEGIGDAWQGRRVDVEAQARELGDAVRHHLGGRFAPAADPPSPQTFAAALRTLEGRFDATWGGFGEAPKFPTPSNLMLLLEVAAEDPSAESPSAENQSARRMLEATLDRMARGGIYDQLAGGFHRYATDREWKVPHFEKMLYDNGSLLEIWARSWELFGDPELARVARETVAFLERELSAPEGGFWSAIDAETGGQEGAFHVWTAAELEAELGPEDAAFLAPLYGFDRPPFFEGVHYVLHLPRPLAEQAERRRVTYDELLASMAPLRAKLLAARERRPHPATDDKVLADWNGLAIAGLAAAGRLLGETAWVERAARAARFVLTVMRPGGTLLHAWRAGQGEVPAFLSDYAYVVHGLLELHAASDGDAAGEWLAAAVNLTGEQRRRLAHPDGGFYTAGESADLLCRSRDLFDGASPSANGVALLNLLRLAELTGDESFRAEADRALRGFAPLVVAQPAAARTVAIAARRFHASAAVGTGSATAGAAPTAYGGLAAEAAGLVGGELHVGVAGADGWRPFRLRLRTADGWHVNTEAAPEGLVATTVEGSGCALRSLAYPAPSRTLAGFGDTPVPVWEGELEIAGELQPGESGRAAVRVVAQPCDEGRCLPPVAFEVAGVAP